MGKLRRVIGIILIIVGVAVIGTVIYKKAVKAQKQKELIDILEGQMTGEGKKENNDDLSLDDINGVPVGILEIPSIKLKQGVVEGVSDSVLKYYLGHYNDTAKPGQDGNCVIAGHRVSDYTDAFINLYKVKKDDEIIIKTEDKKYTYVVTDNFIVDPDQVDVLDNTDGATITLITCTVGAKQRVIVTGNLIKTE